MSTKQTEIGEIPEDWEVASYGDIFQFLSTSTNSRSDLTANGELLYLHYGDIHTKFSTHLNVGETNLPKISENLVSSAMVKDGDVIMADASEDYDGIGKSVEVFNVGTAKMVSGLHTFLLRDTDKQLADGYRGFLHCIPSVKGQFNALATGLKVYGVSKNNLKTVLFPRPPLPEQTAIAAILSDTDRLLAALHALIGKKRAVKTAAMQQLLSGSLRLPEFATNGSLKNSELGEIPEDWEVVKIGEFTDCTAGGTPSTAIPEYWNGDIPWMSSGELHLKQVYDVSGRITELGLDNSSTSIVPEKSVLIGLAGQGKTRGTVAISRIPLCTNQSIAAVFPSNLFCSEYLFYNLENRYEELRSLSTGDGGRGGLNLTIIRNLAVPFPSLPEQTAIAQTLSDMDSEIAALEARAAKLAHIKQGLMQNLLTGKIRVNNEAA